MHSTAYPNNKLLLLVIALLMAASAYAARNYTMLQWEADNTAKQLQLTELHLANAELLLKAEKVNTVVVTQYVDKVRTVKQRAEVIIKEVPVYVSTNSDANCIIPNGFVSLHNDAASNSEVSISSATSSANDSSSAIALSVVASTVAMNYGVCHENAEKLTALQHWVQLQDELVNQRGVGAGVSAK